MLCNMFQVDSVGRESHSHMGSGSGGGSSSLPPSPNTRAHAHPDTRTLPHMGTLHYDTH